MEPNMITFEVKDMTCGHCVSTITKALKSLDKDAQVDVDLTKRIVQIQPGDSDAQDLSDAIKEAGYTPVQVAESAKTTEHGTGCKCH
jgi:copper chaperone